MATSDDEIKKVIRMALIEQRVKNILARRMKMTEADIEAKRKNDKNNNESRN